MRKQPTPRNKAWPEIYLKTVADWEQEKGMIWQEFGYIDDDRVVHMEA